MVRFVAVVVCLFTLVATAGPAEAQYFGRNKVHYDRLDFRVLKTDHFDIYYYAEEEEATRHAARMAERWYARFSRVLHHSFSRRQPLVLYASHPHFGQTNVTPSSPTEGTGGLTERTKSRIAMPFAAGLGETDHVLGHEIAHAFQIDIAKRAGQDAFMLPGWFIEGMAEYLSLGSGDRSHGDVAARRRREQPSADVRRSSRTRSTSRTATATRSGPSSRPATATTSSARCCDRRRAGRSRAFARRPDQTDDPLLRGVARLDLGRGRRQPRDERHSSAHRIAAFDRDGARLHLAPAISPDGRQLMFLSERDRLSLDLFLADAVERRGSSARS